MLVRRILVWCVVAVIVAVTFASQLGSLATFAGLMTAGVAVALQSVILSVVGYFFLIGKYGVRVGDRVQIAGITGDVVDLGGACHWTGGGVLKRDRVPGQFGTLQADSRH